MIANQEARPAAPPFSGSHDHQACIAAAVTAAARLCAGRGARLTALRRRVLEIVWRSHEPTGAYGVLAALGAEGRPAAPPTVYRALDFLVSQGLVHRIESLNAYVGCVHPGEAHFGQFLICGRCGAAAELDDGRVRAAVTRSARRLGFEVRRQTIELWGICAACRAAVAPGTEKGREIGDGVRRA